MKGLTSLVLLLFLACGSAIAADAPEPAPPVAAAPPIAAEAPKVNKAALDDQLFRAVADGKADEVLRLVNAGANPNTPSGAEKKRALNVAAAAGNKKIVEILIAAGADVNAHDGARESPLIAAVRNDKQEVAKLIAAVRIGKIKVDDLRSVNGVTVPLPAAPAVAKPAPSQATAGPVDEIRKAIAEHRLIKGMALADVESALGLNPIQTQNSSDGVSIWKASIWDNFPDNHIWVGLGGTEYTIYIRDGVISSWQSVRFFYGPDGRTHNQQ